MVERTGPATFPNVLADRYATGTMVDIWAPEAKVRLERELWLAVLEAQRSEATSLAATATDAALDDYRRVVDHVDLDAIRARERVTRHDVKARIEEFNALAGHELVHVGLTSRDVTENVEQLQVRRSLVVVRDKAVALGARLAERAVEFDGQVMAARTHNVPAQPTTMGKRLATVGEELLYTLERVEDLLARYPLRGLKGAVGTQQDQLDLLGGAAAVDRVETALAERLGFGRSLGSVGQVYPRALDFDAVATLLLVASPAANLALLVRLLAGHELATEGFREGQVGSSAMPHKMNTRSAERVGGMLNVLRGHVTMAAALAGDQWYEGDVSCSVVRRVVLPDAFLTIDGLLETTLEVVGEMGLYPAMIDEELRRYLPFLSTSRLLIAAVQHGLGRETAHELIRDHAVAAVRQRRQDGSGADDLLARLGADERFPLDEDELRSLVERGPVPVGRAAEQVAGYVARVEKLAAAHPEAAAYGGSAVL